MSEPNSPSYADPFRGMGEASLREVEEQCQQGTTRKRSADSMTTQPPTPPQTATPGPVTDELPIMAVTQTIMQSACKRKKLPSSGSKPALADRLSNAGVRNAREARELATLYAKEGVDQTLEGSVKQKAPNWTGHEAARLCHVIADPRHATALGRLYNKPESRAELDQGRHDPCSAEFVDLFNSDDYNPEQPEPRDGVTEDLLLGFDATQHPHKRNGTFLKTRWNKMRSKYSIAKEKYTKSGQGESDGFDTFTDGDDTLAYMHCVFYGLPSLDIIVRALPQGCGVEAGLNEISQTRTTVKEADSNRKRKGTNDASIADGLSQIAKAVSSPMEINLIENQRKNTPGKFDEFDVSDRIASTVEKLMSLESTIRTNPRNAIMDADEEYIEELRGRLSAVQRRIELALTE